MARELPESFSLDASKRLGLQIIRNLVTHELQGTIQMGNHQSGGTPGPLILKKENNMKVVLVDDESLIRMDLRDILESGGCEIIGEGANGVEAIRVGKTITTRCNPYGCKNARIRWYRGSSTNWL